MNKFITSDKIFHHLKELKKWKSGAVNVHPITVELHLSNVCNNKCYYCSADSVKDKQIMTRVQTTKAIDYIYAQKGKAVIFSGGGEPTVSPCFNYAISYANKLGMDVGVITNAGLLDDLKIKTILEVASWVRVSLDASDPETYKKIRGVDGFNVVKDNFRKLVNLKNEMNSKCTLGLQIVVNEHNYLCLSDAVKSISNQFSGFDYLQIRPIETKLNENPYSKGELNTIQKELTLCKGMKGVLISDKWDLFFNTEHKDFGFSACHCADFIGVIDAYGNYYLCCHTVKNPNYKYCNVFSEPLLSNFFKKRESVLKKLGKSRGLNPAVCPLGCRGSNINRRLEGLLYEPEHKNFL